MNRVCRIACVFLFLLPELVFCQVNDCQGAIEICGNGAISTNANGLGTQEVSGLNSCGSGEHNSIWLKIEITKSGTLGFDLKPTSHDLSVDYDFFIFGPAEDCSNLGTSIRCSTTNPNAAGLSHNHTGMNDQETDTYEGPGPDGNSYVKSLDVLPGETYYIVIDRPIGQSPFNLEWTGTATKGEFPFPDGPEVHKPSDIFQCESSGTSEFDISGHTSEITSQAGTTVTYHKNLADAVDNINNIEGKYTSTSPSKTIYARVENNLTGCAKVTDFDLVITDGPSIASKVQNSSCDIDFDGREQFQLSGINKTILNGLAAEEYEVSFYKDFSSAEYGRDPLPKEIISSGETIYARVENAQNTSCYSISEVELVMNTPPEISNLNIQQPIVNANQNTIKIDLENSENYEYSLGSRDGPYQKDQVFRNVPAGFSTLYVRDKKECLIVSSEIAVLGYDNFFTPNQDGFNDYWQVQGLTTSDSGNLVFIYDRYGKLLKQIAASGKGWDGTFNGKAMPADDYWFKVKLSDGHEFKGHFTLKR
ncbi:MAG: T9SS type B sorting domain-containing protein [Salegentibacter sp.]